MTCLPLFLKCCFSFKKKNGSVLGRNQYYLAVNIQHPIPTHWPPLVWGSHTKWRCKRKANGLIHSQHEKPILEIKSINCEAFLGQATISFVLQKNREQKNLDSGRRQSDYLEGLWWRIQGDQDLSSVGIERSGSFIHWELVMEKVRTLKVLREGIWTGIIKLMVLNDYRPFSEPIRQKETVILVGFYPIVIAFDFSSMIQAITRLHMGSLKCVFTPELFFFNP